MTARERTAERLQDSVDAEFLSSDMGQAEYDLLCGLIGDYEEGGDMARSLRRFLERVGA